MFLGPNSYRAQHDDAPVKKGPVGPVPGRTEPIPRPGPPPSLQFNSFNYKNKNFRAIYTAKNARGLRIANLKAN
jgi:hypothetical protein